MCVYIVSVYPPTPALSRGGRVRGKANSAWAGHVVQWLPQNVAHALAVSHAVVFWCAESIFEATSERIESESYYALAAAVGGRHDPAFAAMVFLCDFGGFSVKSESDIRRWQLWAAGTIPAFAAMVFWCGRACVCWRLGYSIFEATSEDFR